jgi:uncharacterized membrane protein
LNPRLTVALLVYLALAATAGYFLDGRIRLMTWLILGVFALKTVIASIRQDMD